MIDRYQPLLPERRGREVYRISKYHNNIQRGVPFLLTFEEWWGLWQASGHWLERGSAPGKYVMARYEDKGPYAVGNVRICTWEENVAEYQVTRKTRPPVKGKQKMSKETKTVRGRRLYRRRTTCEILDCSLNMVKRLENAGKLKKVRLGTRDIYHPVEDVEKIAAGEGE